MVTPLREVEYLGGVALFGMVKLVIGVGVMVLGALAFFSFHTWSLGFGLVPIVAVLLVVGWAISLFVMGLVLRFGTGAEALAWGVMFVLLPLSGVFYPTKALPTLLQPLALALPTTHAFTALRSLVDHNGQRLGAARDRGASARSRCSASRCGSWSRCCARSASAATSPATPDRDARRRPGHPWPGPSPCRESRAER